MSFGWSAGDIVSAITFLYKVVDALSRLPEASKTYHQTFRFLEITEINLKHLKKILEDHESGIATIQDDGRVQHLRVICSNFKLSVDELGKKLAEHCGLDKKAKGLHWPEQQLGKLKWKFFDEDSIKKLMDDVNNQSTQLQIFLQIQNTSTTADIKHMLENLIRDRGFSPVAPVTLSPSTAPNPPPHIPAETALQHLLAHESHTLSGRFSQSSRTLKADAVLMHKIRAWLSGRASPRLWLLGKDYTTIGGIFFEVGRRSYTKIVAYSCRHQWNGRIQDHEARLVGLVYAFLYQLLSQMPEGIAVPEKIKDQGWDTLDGTLSTLEVAIGFLRVLIEMLPKCIAVVEGFQWLSDSTNGRVNQLLKELVELFGEAKGDAVEALGTRLLCLTKKNSEMLMDYCQKYGQEYFSRLELERHVNKSGERFEQALLRAEW